MFKSVIYGIAAGLLGGAVSTAALAFIHSASVESLTYQAAGARLVGGALWGIVLSLLHNLLPKHTGLQIALVGAIVSVSSIVSANASHSAGINGTMIVLGVISGFVYAGVALFVLDQAHNRALTVWPPLRRADEFSDNPAESH